MKSGPPLQLVKYIFQVKNGTVSKLWLTEITGPPPDGIPNILVEETDRYFRNLCIGIMANICGLR